MEWSYNANRIVVTALFKRQMEKADIFITLRPLGIGRMFVNRCVKLFVETTTGRDVHAQFERRKSLKPSNQEFSEIRSKSRKSWHLTRILRKSP